MTGKVPFNKKKKCNMTPLTSPYTVHLDTFRDLLFREIYDKFCEDPVGKVVFLESLEPHILSDK